jgi:hypothetical protein
MSKRLSVQASKRSSAFSALIQAHQEPVGAGKSAIGATPTTKVVGKSADPAFVKLTSYIRKDTHLAVKKRLLDEGREISELVEDLFGQWLKANNP